MDEKLLYLIIVIVIVVCIILAYSLLVKQRDRKHGKDPYDQDECCGEDEEDDTTGPSITCGDPPVAELPTDVQYIYFDGEGEPPAWLSGSQDFNDVWRGGEGVTCITCDPDDSCQPRPPPRPVAEVVLRFTPVSPTLPNGGYILFHEVLDPDNDAAFDARVQNYFAMSQAEIDAGDYFMSWWEFDIFDLGNGALPHTMVAVSNFYPAPNVTFNIDGSECEVSWDPVENNSESGLEYVISVRDIGVYCAVGDVWPFEYTWGAIELEGTTSTTIQLRTEQEHDDVTVTVYAYLNCEVSEPVVFEAGLPIG